MTPLRVLRLDLPLDAPAFDPPLNADPAIALSVLARAGDAEAARRALAAAHVYHVSSAKDELPREWFVDRALIERAPHLLAVSTYGAGFDTVDLAACTAAGIAVVNQAGGNAAAVAEHTFGFMIGLAKRIIECDRRLRRGERFTREEAMGTDLAGRTLGLVGIGHVGRRVAALGKAFGMNVIATDPNVARDEIVRRGARAVSFSALLGEADIVSVHCPLDATTRGMFDARAFASMRRGALFISTARGGIHDEAALHAALIGGHLGGAGLDVWGHEPPPPTHPLLALDNVFVSHHIAGVTRGARRNLATIAAEQICAIARGERPPRLANPQVWPAYARRFAALTGRAARP